MKTDMKQKQSKRKMVCVLNVEEFEQTKQMIEAFERQMVQELGGTSSHLSDSKAFLLMSRICASALGRGRDLYLCSQQRTFEMVTHLVVTQVDEHISAAVRALADWLELKITYTREGSNFTFRYEKPGFGIKELQIPMLHHREPPNQYPVN